MSLPSNGLRDFIAEHNIFEAIEGWMTSITGGIAEAVQHITDVGGVVAWLVAKKEGAESLSPWPSGNPRSPGNKKKARKKEGAEMECAETAGFISDK